MFEGHKLHNNQISIFGKISERAHAEQVFRQKVCVAVVSRTSLIYNVKIRTILSKVRLSYQPGFSTSNEKRVIYRLTTHPLTKLDLKEYLRK